MKSLLGKKIRVGSFIFSVLLAMIMIVFAALQMNGEHSYFQVFTFVINGIVIYAMFVKGLARHLFSVDLIHSIFCLVFFWIAPTLQIATGFSAWGLRIGEEDIIRANLLILTWLIFYNFGAFLASNRYWKIKTAEFSAISKKSIMTLWWITIIVSALIVVKNGFRIEEISFSDSDNQAIGLLVNHSLVAFMTFSTLITVLWFKNNGYSKIYPLISIICLLLTCFPTSLSRYAAGAIYVCLLVNLCPWFQKKHRFVFLMILGIMLLFPIMGLYRYRSIAEVSINEIINQLFSVKEYFSTANYDAYQLLIASTQFVNLYDITCGLQLLGALLFFVPRQIWSSKPVGSGNYISEMLGLTFKNISCPLVAESYINFGVIGVILFALVLGFLFRKIDNTFWMYVKGKFSYISLLYFYLLPYTLFLCRGDLMSTWAYLCANLAVLFVLVKMLQKKRNW